MVSFNTFATVAVVYVFDSVLTTSFFSVFSFTSVIATVDGFELGTI